MKLYSEAISVKSHLPITTAVSLRLVSYCFSIVSHNSLQKWSEHLQYTCKRSTDWDLLDPAFNKYAAGGDYSMNIYIYEYL